MCRVNEAGSVSDLWGPIAGGADGHHHGQIDVFHGNDDGDARFASRAHVKDGVRCDMKGAAERLVEATDEISTAGEDGDEDDADPRALTELGVEDHSEHDSRGHRTSAVYNRRPEPALFPGLRPVTDHARLTEGEREHATEREKGGEKKKGKGKRKGKRKEKRKKKR